MMVASMPKVQTTRAKNLKNEGSDLNRTIAKIIIAVNRTAIRFHLESIALSNFLMVLSNFMAHLRG